jgi:hypothetical protein
MFNIASVAPGCRHKRQLDSNPSSSSNITPSSRKCFASASQRRLPHVPDFHIAASTEELAVILEEEGFALLRQHVPEGVIAQLRDLVEKEVKDTLALKGISIVSQDFRELLQVNSKEWSKTPPGFCGKPWGGVKSLGWIKSLGGGRMLSTLLEHETLLSVQEHLRDICARIMGVPPNLLTRRPEGVSIKVPGCPEAATHVDFNRVGTLQIIIAVTPTSFVLYPKTHTDHVLLLEAQSAGTAKGYHVLSRASLDSLQQRCNTSRLEIEAQPGDCCVFQGGLVHSSPAVQTGVRICTYAHFE